MSSNGNKLTLGISHVGLAVSDLDASLAFFRALGFAKVGGDESYPSHFVSDGTTLVTLWQTEDGATPFNRRRNVGLHHLAVRVPSQAALQEAYARAVEVNGAEAEFSPRDIQGMPLKHAMVREPSGNRIEFTYHEE